MENNGMIDLTNPKYYENRELSWLEFNQRVLDQAMNQENPLSERLKFLGIVSSNLDEFFMVRVASLKAQVTIGYEKLDFSGLTPKEILRLVGNRAHKMVADQAKHYKYVLIPELKKAGCYILENNELTLEQITYIEAYFDDEIYPVLTPLAVDSSRPFPLILNKSLNIGALINKDGNELFATVQVPSVMPRYIPLPSQGDEKAYILLGSVIRKYIYKLFLGYEVLCAFPYRISRNADLSLDEGVADDLLLEIEKSIKKRKRGNAIRIEVQKDMDERLVKFLQEALKIHKRDIFYIEGPLDLTFLMKFNQVLTDPKFKYPVFEPKVPRDLLGVDDIFEAIKEKDLFLSHPYEQFDPVVDLIKQAAIDDKVLAIKQTLYRVSGQSPIIKALTKAAEAGKQVTVLVELKARFDEENNIQWARKLERSGCHVIYGLVGLKTHSKVTLIVRKEDSGIQRYVHLSTGNYNDITAKLYTDMGILTCNEQIGSDVSAVFNSLSGYSEPPKLKKITMAPNGLREKLYELIDQEIANSEDGKESHIIIKMNSLCDAEMIERLYRASCAGVKVDLLVRGICSLIPGIPNVSEQITVKSLVGRYLEHNRIYYFKNKGENLYFLSSADLMPRNLNRRVELLFPIDAQDTKERLKDYLDMTMADNVLSKVKDSDCKYHAIQLKEGEKRLNTQTYYEEEATVYENRYKTLKDREMVNINGLDQY